MTNISRRSFAKSAAAVTAAVAGGFHIGGVHAADFKLRYANNLPASHPMNVRATEAAAEIAKRSNGKVEMQVYPNNQLGNDTSTLAQLRSGAVDFFTLSPIILGSLVPSAQISGVGFAFKDDAQVWKAMDGDLGEHVRAEIAKTELFAFKNIWDNGFRVTTTSKTVIKGPEDLKGVKLRVPPGPLWVSMFKALGAAPASINFAEVYAALQTNVVDGQENPVVLVWNAKLFEVQKHLALTNHMWDGFWFLGNKRSFDRLPSDMKDIVRESIEQAGLKQRADIVKLNETAAGQLKGAGMVFNEVNTDAFRDALRAAGFYQEWHKKFGDAAWSMLEKFTGKLA